MVAKPKAPEWLRESFRDGVDEEQFCRGRDRGLEAVGAFCELAQHDPLQRPCSGGLERFHYVNRQRVENAFGAVIPSYSNFVDFVTFDPAELILLAAWDPRVGGIACEHHHRRLDSHATPPLVLPYDALPGHVIEWSEDYGMESQLENRFPKKGAA